MPSAKTAVQSVCAELGLTPTLSLFESSPLPFGAVDFLGQFLYCNPALETLFKRCGLDEREGLFDLLHAESGVLPLQAHGFLDPQSLPFLCRCRLGAEDGPELLLRLEKPPRDLTPHAQLAFCTLSPYEADLSPSALEQSWPQWQGQLQQIGDSFDMDRIGAKACALLQEMTQARAVHFYCLRTSAEPEYGIGWERVEQLGMVLPEWDPPDRMEAGLDWMRFLSDVEQCDFKQLHTALEQRSMEPPPAWLPLNRNGLLLACNVREEMLGLAVILLDGPAKIPSEKKSLLSLTGFETAQAIEHARWFQFAHRAESRGENLVQSANALILGLDVQGRITLTNQKGRDWLGYEPEELKGKRFHELFGPDKDAREVGRRQMDALFQSGEPLSEFECSLMDKAGRPRAFIWSVNVLASPSGAVLGWTAIGQDITRRKRLEEDLARSEKRYRNLVESTHDLYWIFEMDGAFNAGKLLFLNRDFGGYPRAALEARGAEEWAKAFRPESWERFVLACRKVWDLGEPVYRLETEHPGWGENDECLYFQHDLFLYKDGDRVAGIQGLSVDVTAQKEMEMQMLQAQKTESMGTLARGICHDFNNILNGINSFAYLIQHHLTEPEKIQDHCQAILEMSQRAGGLTRQLQSYARHQQGESRPLDLNDLLRQSAKILDGGVSRHLEMTLDLHDKLKWVEGDRSQLEQVIMNICINAAEAMTDGGVLNIRTYPVHLTPGEPTLPQGMEEGEYNLLQISDNGPGMSAQVKARIFDPFYTTKQTGNGLGLSAVYGIMKSHEGWIRVDSELGVGSCFSLYFPAVEARDQLFGEYEHANIRGGNETILVVDDEEPVRLVAEDILSTLGYRVIVAASGEEAINIFKERPQSIQLAVMDMTMPSINGCATAKAMRLEKPDLNVLFTSGFLDRHQLEDLQAEGFHHFLHKPYSLVDLQRNVRACLDQNKKAEGQK